MYCVRLSSKLDGRPSPPSKHSPTKHPIPCAAPSHVSCPLSMLCRRYAWGRVQDDPHKSNPNTSRMLLDISFLTPLRYPNPQFLFALRYIWRLPACNMLRFGDVSPCCGDNCESRCEENTSNHYNHKKFAVMFIHILINSTPKLFSFLVASSAS